MNIRSDEYADKNNIDLIDLTCPKVLKIHKIVSEYIILQIKMYVHKYYHIIVEFQEENRYNINGHKIRLIFGK